MLVTATYLALLLSLQAEPIEDLPEAMRLTSAEVAERIPLPRLRGDVEIEVWPLNKQVVLIVPQDAKAVAARIAGASGALCRKVIVKDDRVELNCRSRRLDATLTREGNELFLELFELRGLPWRRGPEGPPEFAFAPELSDMGGPCPGNTDAGRGECALMDGKLVEAAGYFRKAMTSIERASAVVRLGDLSLIAGDPATAVGWYLRAGVAGHYGRLAQTRLCEMNAQCFRAKPQLDPLVNDFPAPLRRDILLRRSRAYAYLDEWAESLRVLAEAFAAPDGKALCQGGGAALCRRLVLAALRNTSGKQSELALETFLAVPDRDKGPFAVEMSQVAADVAARLGAPLFGANLLSTAVPLLQGEGQSEHLVRAAELFLAGRDAVRARVILEYAESRTPQSLNQPRWAAVRRGLASEELAISGLVAAADRVMSPSALAAQTVAEALAISTKARDWLQMMESRPGGKLSGKRK